MIKSGFVDVPGQASAYPHRIGTPGYMAVFFWSLALVVLAPSGRQILAIALSLGLAAGLYPVAFQGLLRGRWLLLGALLALPAAFWAPGPGDEPGRLAITSGGLLVALNIFLRALVVLVSVEGFSSRVDVTEVAGLLERIGLHGLGFSMGVAVNLLPGLRISAANAWHSLWMRGGLRRKRWRGIQLLLLTIGVNTLRRAEEIALAAESRAYSPAQTRQLPLKHGRLDSLLIAGCLITLGGILLFP